MQTRLDKIRKKGAASNIRAFTTREAEECYKGDCDRYFKFTVLENYNSEKNVNKELHD